MICAECAAGRHDQCPALTKGRSWCDCQHQPTDPPVEPATGHASE